MTDPMSSTANRTRRPAFDPGPPPAGRPRRSRMLVAGLPLIAVFVAFGAVIWLAYDEGIPGPPVGEPPLVKANPDPFKVSPEPGQTQLAGDGTFEQLLDGDPPAEPEVLLPSPESPVLPDREPATDQLAEALTGSDNAPITESALQPPDAVGTEAPGAADEASADPVAAAETLEELLEGISSGATEDQTGTNRPPAVEAPPPLVVTPPSNQPAVVAEAPAANATSIVVAPAEPATDAPDVSAEVTDRQPARESPLEPAPIPDQTAAVRPAIGGANGSQGQPATGGFGSTPEVPAATAPATEQAALARPAAEAEGADIPIVELDSGAGGPGTTFRIQLAAVRAEADARRAWDLFLVDLGPVLTNVQPVFERADTSNGVFYRVQVGPFGNLQEAESLCEDLKQRNASCFVVRR